MFTYYNTTARNFQNSKHTGLLLNKNELLYRRENLFRIFVIGSVKLCEGAALHLLLSISDRDCPFVTKHAIAFKLTYLVTRALQAAATARL
jgi:hypothetical protein